MEESIKDILTLLDLILSLPASSAEAERGFSLLKVTKTDWRSNLKDTTLTDLFTIKLSCPEVGEYDPEPAISLWNSRQQRKPDFCRKPKLGQAQESSDSVSDISEEVPSEFTDSL
jgi:hypothetical protein